MPKGRGGNRGKRTKRNGGTIEIRYRARILIGGPAEDEDDVRADMRDSVYQSLARCPYLTAAGLSDRYADEIIASVPWITAPTRRATIDELDVVYRNPPNHWKWWSRIRNDQDTIEPGDWA